MLSLGEVPGAVREGARAGAWGLRSSAKALPRFPRAGGCTMSLVTSPPQGPTGGAMGQEVLGLLLGRVRGSPLPAQASATAPWPPRSPGWLPRAAQHPQPGFVPLGPRSQPCPQITRLPKESHCPAISPRCPTNSELAGATVTEQQVSSRPSGLSCHLLQRQHAPGGGLPAAPASEQPWHFLMTNSPDVS